EPARPADVAVQKPAGELVASLRHNRTDKRKSHDPDAFCKVSSWKIHSTLCFDEKPKNDQSAAGRVARAREASSPNQGRSPDRQPTDPRAQARETQHGFYGIGRFDGHRRARPQAAR